MYIRINNVDKVIDNKLRFAGQTTRVRDIDAVEQAVKEGYNIDIRENKEWVDGKKYFNIGKRKAEVTAENIEVQETEEDKYEDLFEGHWKKQVKRVEEYSDNPRKIEKVLQYALENDVSDAVIERVEDYLEELQG